MSELEKINRELMMIGNDIRLMKESALLRIIRNKRQPIAARYAAVCLYSPDVYDTKIDLSDESLISEINQFLHEIDFS